MCEFAWLQHWQHLIQDLVVCLMADLIMYAYFKLCTVLWYITHTLILWKNEKFAHNDLRKYSDVMRNVWDVLFKTHLMLVWVLMRHTSNPPETWNTPREVCVLTPLGLFCAWNLRLRTIDVVLAVSLFERVTGIWFQKERTFERDTALQAPCVELGLLLWEQTVNCKCSKHTEQRNDSLLAYSFKLSANRVPRRTFGSKSEE
jgi:hypothetical protein